MAVHVRESGSYELIETTKKNRILVLEGETWFAWVEGQQGEILVLSDEEHKRRRMIQQGNYFLVDVDDDPRFRDVPHLFLGNATQYEECILPNGLPDERDTRKKIIRTGTEIEKEELEQYLEAAATGQEKEGSSGRG